MVLSFFHEMGSKTVRSCRSPPPVFGRTEQTNVKFHAQFLAVCRSSILAETLGYAASFSSPWRGKRRVVERRKSLFMDQLQLSTNSDKLSDPFYVAQSLAPFSGPLRRLGGDGRHGHPVIGQPLLWAPDCRPLGMGVESVQGHVAAVTRGLRRALALCLEALGTPRDHPCARGVSERNEKDSQRD